MEAEQFNEDEHVNAERRDLAIDAGSLIPIDDKADIAMSLVEQKPLTHKILEEMDILMDKTDNTVNGLSVGAARCWNLDVLSEAFANGTPLHSVDYAPVSGITEIVNVYKEAFKEKKITPKEFIGMSSNVVGEYLLHTNDKSAGRDTAQLSKDMVKQKGFSIVRLDSYSHLQDISKTYRDIRKLNYEVKSPMSVVVEIKPSPTLEDFLKNINAYEALKLQLSNDGVPLYLSLDVRALYGFSGDKDTTLELISNLLSQRPEQIGLMEISGLSHNLPFNDEVCMKSIDMVKDIERHKNPWAKVDSSNESKKLGIVIETHPACLRDLASGLNVNKDIIY